MATLAVRARGGSALPAAGLFLALCAGGVAAAIAIKGPGLPGCGAGSGCDEVTSGRWAWWGPIAVAVPGAAAYVVMAGLLAAAMHWAAKWVHLLLFGCAAAVLASIVWFVVIQAFVIGRFCQYCMADHALGAAAAVLACVVCVRHGHRWPGWAALPAAAAVAALIGGQFLLPAHLYREYKPGPSIGKIEITGNSVSNPATRLGGPRHVLFLNGKLDIQPQQYLLLGDPDADCVVVELFDYTCPHCRKMAPLIEQARQRYGHQLAVVVFPVPLNILCNDAVRQTDSHAENACDYAYLAMAVWRTAPAKFPEFHAWMLTGQDPPSVEDARKRAEELVGRDALAAALAPRYDKPMQVGIEIYRALGGHIIPKLIVGDTVIVGELPDADTLYKKLGLKPL